MKSWLLLAALCAWLTAGCYGDPTDTDLIAQAASVRSVVPVINASMKARLRSIYLAGLSRGNRASVFSKVGDSITATGSFLTDIGCYAENVATHTELNATIDYFRNTSLPGRAAVWCGISNSFSADSVAAASGWTTASVLAPVSVSGCSDSALRCELRLTRPSVALVMLGTNDLERINDLTVYRNNLTQIVTDAINLGVIPVLSTIPPRLDSATLGARVSQYNDVIAQVASSQQVPLWDYALSLSASSMINQGMDPDGIHPSVYMDQYACSFTDAGLRYGYNQRNMTAVQVLAHVKAIVIDDGAPDADATTDGGTLDSGTDAAVDTGTDAGARGVIPSINASMKSRLRAVYSSDLSRGNRASVFSKVGDSITATGSFLTDIGCYAENVATHTELNATIDYFRSTSLPGRAAVWCGISSG